MGVILTVSNSGMKFSVVLTHACMIDMLRMAHAVRRDVSTVSYKEKIPRS